MRTLFVLLAMSVGIVSFAANGRPNPPMGFKIHVWSCSDVNGGIDHGFHVGIDNDSRKGLVATVSMQSIMGPQSIGNYQVSEVRPTIGRGQWAYLDKASYGRNFTVSISAVGHGRFHAVDARGNTRRGVLRCFRTRGL